MESVRNFWHEWRGFLLFVALMLVVRSAVADWNQVPSGSMKPNILEGDRIVVNKLAYDLRVPFTFMRVDAWADPQRGDVVTFDSPLDERLFVKRVIGVPGDVVELRANKLFVNGVAATYQPLRADEIAKLPMQHPECHQFFHETIDGQSRVIMIEPSDEPSLSRPPAHCRLRHDVNNTYFPPVTVPEGSYLMLGDNRDDSGDYRMIGMVARWRVLGRAHAIAFSVGDYYLPRLDRFFIDLH